MHDPVSPLLNVLHADGPGCIPLRICHFCCSHKVSNQGARLLVCGSSLFRGMVTSSMLGDKSATRAFQSPQITCTYFYGINPTTSSTWLRASSSSIPLLTKLRSGGKYIFPTHTFSLPYPCIQIIYAYSLPILFIILIPFLTRIAIPPRFPYSLRYSKT
jgi:hypothetical protein